MCATETSNVDRLLREARTLLGAGRVAEARPVLMGLLNVDPRHLEVRNALAVVAMGTGNLAEARLHLDAALAVAPDDVLTLNQIAQLQQAEGDLVAALQTYGRLLARQPSLYTARLACAHLFEVTGDLDAACLHAFRALRDAHQAGRWLSADSTPPALRAAVAHANALVTQHRRQLCWVIVDPLVARYGVGEMRRVAGFVAIQLGEATYAPVDARQRPSSFPFPGLPQAPYLDKRRFASVAALESQTPVILAELQSALDRQAGQEKVFADQALADEFLRGERGPAVWDGHYFYRHGVRNEANATACPQTMAAVDKLPLSRVPGHGPEVLFSILGPGTHLLPHFGVTNARVVGHLPLIVPADCALAVAGQQHRWEVGEVVLFDDTYSHEAWNRSANLRVVLIFDMWHPDLTEGERVAMRDLQESLGRFSSSASELDCR